MLDTAQKIRETGNIRTASQKVINIPNTATMFGYIVADITPSLRAIAGDNDFRPTWDKAGFYRYHETRDIFIEIIPYDKLLTDAKKRNALFFEVRPSGPGQKRDGPKKARPGAVRKTPRWRAERRHTFDEKVCT